LYAHDLLGSLCKEVFETFLPAELVTAPTVTDETKRTIVGVTSPWLFQVFDPVDLISRLITFDPSVAVESLKFPQTVITPQRRSAVSMSSPVTGFISKRYSECG
jgi:hypothetical protein